MFRTATIRRLSNRLKSVAVWAMIPLAVLNGRTVSGCICADGHYEATCNTSVCSGGTLNSVDTAEPASCGCSCCAHRADKQGGSDGCRKMSCCSRTSHRPTQSSGGESFSDKGCCQPVSQTHVTPSVVVKSGFDELRPSELLTTDAAASLQSIFAAAAHRFAGTHTDVCPCTVPDLVITLRKLVI